ncbi:MAG TPA: C69 family dipeptidase [Spirochaetota bacterium]|nr:C69 family dipeptidase [Spirochaetota bacterium]
MCDTVVATAEATIDGSVILAKNSDREPNEVQLLHHLTARSFANPGELQCTFLKIPQASRTAEVLLSRPAWMWGCEMGANAAGLCIGNEAVFTKEPYAKTGLTGMDLLRLALERTSKAEDALALITELIARYGQGGNCGYTGKLYYHNSFIIADKKDAWVLETAGRHWAALRVRGVRSISNGLTIDEEYDMLSTGAEDYALRKGYIRRGAAFGFRRAFSDTIITHFSKCRVRQSRTMELLRRHEGKITPSTMMALLRDHGGDSRSVQPHATDMGTVCMHASFGPLRASQSTSALVSHLRADLPVHWATGSSGTCTGIFKPFYLGHGTIDFLNAEAPEHFSSDIFWWRHEILHRQALTRYPFWKEQIAPKRDELERGFIEREEKLYRSFKKSPGTAKPKLTSFSGECFSMGEKESAGWLPLLETAPATKGIPFRYRFFWGRRTRDARMPERS